MSEQQKSKHVFFFNEETCECPYHCGPLSDRDGKLSRETLTAIGHLLAPALEELQRGEFDVTEIVLELREMTDTEVDALPGL